MAKRKRTQVGERISPWAVDPVTVKTKVGCPICHRLSPLAELFDAVPNGVGGLTTSLDPWSPMPVLIKPMRQWPRKPDGGRGFHWEPLPAASLERDAPGITNGVTIRFASRMLDWLDSIGVDAEVARESLESLEATGDGFWAAGR